MAAVTKLLHTRKRHGYAGIRGKYATYANRAYSSIFGQTRVYASSRGNIKDYQSSHKYSQIRGLDIRRYADIRGHSHRFTVTYPRMAFAWSRQSPTLNRNGLVKCTLCVMWHDIAHKKILQSPDLLLAPQVLRVTDGQRLLVKFALQLCLDRTWEKK